MRLIRKVLKGGFVGRSGLDQKDVVIARGSRARDLLAQAGLRPTWQRLAVAELLFAAGGRHVSAIGLHDELARQGTRVSLCCIYSSLRRLSEIGLIHRVPVYGETAYFDTQVSHHHHFYVVHEDRLIDVPSGAIEIHGVPAAPEGYDLIGIDVVLRLKPSRQPTP
jgi:Fur family transcriptional regulator, iron response regulator